METAQQWLKRARVLAGFPKQENLAAAVGVGRGAVGNWETTGKPSLANVPALASALGVDPQEIIDRFRIPAGEGVQVAVPSWVQQLTGRLDQQTELLRRLAEERAPYGSRAVERASVVPAPTARKRRTHWLKLARARRGWSPADVDRRLGRSDKPYSAWEKGTTSPRGAEIRNLAEALDIPEWVITDPPITDEERLAALHVGDDRSLQEAM